jgi:hypothetical protein
MRPASAGTALFTSSFPFTLRCVTVTETGHISEKVVAAAEVTCVSSSKL